VKQVWTFAWLNAFPMLSGKPLSPSQTVKNTSLTLRFFGSLRQANQNFADSLWPSRLTPIAA